MKDFNIAKYLRENSLGSHAILGRYVDLHALKEAENIEGLEPVKDIPILVTQQQADLLAKVCTDAGMTGVKAVEIAPNKFKIYADPGQETKSIRGNLNKEADYGNNEPVDEVPYVGAEEKLDGFGDEFDQVAPVEEAASAWEEKLNYYESEINDLVYDMVDTTGADADQIADFFQYISTQIRNKSNFGSMEEDINERMISYPSDMQIDGKVYDVDLGFKSFRSVYDADSEQFIFQYPDQGGRKSISKYDNSIKSVELHQPNKSPFTDPGYMNRD